MHRTQLYFDEAMFEEVKETASSINLSVSAYIREVLKKELARKHPQTSPDFSDFAGMWKDEDISLDTIREKAWK